MQFTRRSLPGACSAVQRTSHRLLLAVGMFFSLERFVMYAKVADWSGWVDNDYQPPREIPLWELWDEEGRGFSMYPSNWQYIGFEADADEN